MAAHGSAPGEALPDFLGAAGLRPVPTAGPTSTRRASPNSFEEIA